MLALLSFHAFAGGMAARPAVEFVFAPAPPYGLAPHAIPESVEGARVDPTQPCTCDEGFLSCRAVELGEGAELVVYWSIGSVLDWPVDAGRVGTCRHAAEATLSATGAVRCERTSDGRVQVTVRDVREAAGARRCAEWEGGHVDVQPLWFTFPGAE